MLTQGTEKRRAGFGLIVGLAAAALGRSPALGSVGDSLWKFFADYSVTTVEPIADLSGNGAEDLLVGSQDDTLYAVEAKGAGAGKQLWSFPFKSTLSAAAAMPDLNGDGKPEAAGGDQSGMVAVINGADGKLKWRYLTGLGTVLSLAALPDVNGDGAGDLAVGSELDSVYCLSGNPGGGSGKELWSFGVPASKTHGPPGGMTGPGAKIMAGPPVDVPSGANSLAVIGEKNKAPSCLAVGTNNDTVYCLGLADGAVKWKSGLPGDIWKVTSFPDMTGDGVEEVLLACGADSGYLLNGANGEVLWSHAVSQGGVSVAATADMDGDGKADALIGDGNGTVHCVSGAAKGTGVKAVWTYDFGDASTILSIASPGDIDKDGKADCIVGTSNDSVALISGKGTRLWAAGLGGQVPNVAALGDIDGNGSPDWVAGTEMGFAEAFSGEGNVSLLAPRPAAFGRASLRLNPSLPLFTRPGSGVFYDGRGRAYPRSNTGARREGQGR
ncbi:MAG: VCBS repeat-containing protein [Fibrobacteres bacterium]|nr:VCBS repeat-containing protein [Fibrobacterota bacterium]